MVVIELATWHLERSGGGQRIHRREPPERLRRRINDLLRSNQRVATSQPAGNAGFCGLAAAQPEICVAIFIANCHSKEAQSQRFVVGAEPSAGGGSAFMPL